MENKVITLQKTVYLNSQSREEGGCARFNSNVLDYVYQYVMSDKKMERIYNWFDKNKWEFFPLYKNDEAKVDYYDSHGWNGIMKVFPFIDRDDNVECRLTVIFNPDDVDYFNCDYKIDEYKRDDDSYNFHAESDFYAVLTSYDDFMICKGENSLGWDIDDGYVKWDCNRENGSLISNGSPIYNLFPASNEDYHGVGIPYKVRIIVDAKI